MKNDKIKSLIWIIIISIFSIFLLQNASAYNGDVCNDTHSPCGGGCTSTDLSNMFQSVTDFDNTVGNISGWNTSCITSMNSLFLGAIDFNQNINSWDTSSVEDMSYTFSGTNLYNQPLNNWDTHNVITMDEMFTSAQAFNQNINSWNTSNVIIMTAMFADAWLYNQSMNNWDVHNVTDMSQMFQSSGVTSFDGDIHSWNTSSVTTMTLMFYGATNFNQPLYWNFTQIVDMSDFLTSAGFSTNNYDILINQINSTTLQNSVQLDGGTSYYSYLSNASHDYLVNIRGWTINDAGYDGSVPPIVSTFSCSGLCQSQEIPMANCCIITPSGTNITYQIFNENMLLMTQGNAILLSNLSGEYYIIFNESEGRYHIILSNGDTAYINVTDITKDFTVNGHNDSWIIDIIFIVLIIIFITVPLYLNDKRYLISFMASGLLLGAYTHYLMNRLWLLYTYNTGYIIVLQDVMYGVSAMIFLIGCYALLKVVLPTEKKN